MSTGQPTIDQAIAAQPRVLLTVTIGSRVVRLTDGGPLTVARARALDPSLFYRPGLMLQQPVDRLARWGEDALDRNVSFTAALGFDLADAIEQGHDLYQGGGELAQLYDGQTWEQRRVLISGRLSAPQYGADGEAVSMAIVDSPGDDRGRFLASSQQVSAETWPRSEALRGTAYSVANDRSSEAIVGASYNIIIGAPGFGGVLKIAGGLSSWSVPAAPALYVELTDSNVITTDHVYQLAGHGLTASSATIHNMTDDIEDTVVPESAVDSLGQLSAVASPTLGPTIPLSDNAKIYVSFDPATGGGLADPYGPGALRRADHLIRWALESSTIRWDRSQIDRLTPLAAYKFDGLINDPNAAPWPWLNAYILPLLPVMMVGGPDGVYIAPLDPDAPAHRAVAKLEAGRNARRLTPVTHTSESEVINDYTLEFGLNAATGLYGQWRQCRGAPLSAADQSSDYVADSLWATRSRARFGMRADGTETPYVYDGATAELICERYVRLRSAPRLTVGYALKRDLDWLRPGDVVSLTDPSMHWSARPFHVEALSMVSGQPQVALTSWEQLRYAQ